MLTRNQTRETNERASLKVNVAVPLLKNANLTLKPVKSLRTGLDQTADRLEEVWPSRMKWSELIDKDGPTLKWERQSFTEDVVTVRSSSPRRESKTISWRPSFKSVEKEWLDKVGRKYPSVVPHRPSSLSLFDTLSRQSYRGSREFVQRIDRYRSSRPTGRLGSGTTGARVRETRRRPKVLVPDLVMSTDPEECLLGGSLRIVTTRDRDMPTPTTRTFSTVRGRLPVGGASRSATVSGRNITVTETCPWSSFLRR